MSFLTKLNSKKICFLQNSEQWKTDFFHENYKYKNNVRVKFRFYVHILRKKYIDHFAHNLSFDILCVSMIYLQHKLCISTTFQT